MQRYFVADEQWSAETVILKGEQAHHIVRVMRMSAGDVIICIDEQGQAAYSRLTHIHAVEVTCQVEKWLDADSELAINITVAQGDLKADKYEWVIQKATEMGAAAITNFPADHSVVKWDDKKKAKRQARFEKIARESAEQSERLHIPAIARKESLASLLEEASTYDHLWIISEQSARIGDHYALDDALRSVRAAENILLIFGPEGGFSDREHRECIDAGFVPVSLGPRILRAETAPVATLAMLVYHVDLKR